MESARSKGRSKTSRLKLDFGKEFADKLGSDVKIDQPDQRKKEQDENLKDLLGHFGMENEELQDAPSTKSAALAFAMSAFKGANKEKDADSIEDKSLALSAKFVMKLKHRVQFNKDTKPGEPEEAQRAKPSSQACASEGSATTSTTASGSVSLPDEALKEVIQPADGDVATEQECTRSPKKKLTATELSEAKAPEPLHLRDLVESPRRRRDPEAPSHYDYFATRKLRGADELNANSAEYREAMKRRVALGRGKFDSNATSASARPPSSHGDPLSPKTPGRHQPWAEAHGEDGDLRTPRTPRGKNVWRPGAQPGVGRSVTAPDASRLPDIRRPDRAGSTRSVKRNG